MCSLTRQLESVVILVHFVWVGVARKVWPPRGAFGATLPPVFVCSQSDIHSYNYLLLSCTGM